MSIRRPKGSTRDYARKWYHSNLSYPEQMRKPTEKAVRDVVATSNPAVAEFSGRDLSPDEQNQFDQFVRQSIYKKTPGKSYKAMEDQWDNLPGINLNYPRIADFPWWTFPVPTLGGLLTVFDAESDDCYCPLDIRVVNWTTTQPVTSVQVTLTDDSDTRILGVNGIGQEFGTIELQGGATEAGPVTVEWNMRSAGGVIGSSNVNIPECRKCDVFQLVLTTEDGLFGGEILSPGDFQITHPGGSSTAVGTYLSSTNTWIIRITSGFSATGQYWIQYSPGGIYLSTQYPRIVRTSLKQMPGDLISSGTYTDTIPFYEVVSPWTCVSPAPFDCSVTTSVPDCDFAAGDPLGCGSTNYPCDSLVGPSATNAVTLGLAQVVRWEATVRSSIDYQVDQDQAVGGALFRIGFASYYGTNDQCGGPGSCLASTTCSAISPTILTNALVVETTNAGLPAASYPIGSGQSFPVYGFNSAVFTPAPAGRLHFFQYALSAPATEPVLCFDDFPVCSVPGPTVTRTLYEWGLHFQGNMGFNANTARIDWSATPDY